MEKKYLSSGIFFMLIIIILCCSTIKLYAEDVIEQNQSILPWHKGYNVFYPSGSWVKYQDTIYVLEQDAVSNEDQLENVAKPISETPNSDEAIDMPIENDDSEIDQGIDSDILPWYPNDNVLYPKDSIVSFQEKKYIINQDVISENVILENVSEEYTEEAEINTREIKEEVIESDMYQSTFEDVTEFKEETGIELLNIETKEYTENSANIFISATFDDAVINETDITDNNIELIEDDESLTIDFHENGLEYINEESGISNFADEQDDYSLEAKNVEGGAQLLYTIENEMSKKELDLEIKLEKGQKLMTNDLNEVYIEDENGEVVAIVGSPWATDSEGNFIETYYIIKENGEIKQVVKYDGDNYPLKVDPTICKETINNTKSKMTSKYTFAAYPNKCTRSYGKKNFLPAPSTNMRYNRAMASKIMKDAWSETLNDYHYQKYVANKYDARMKDQFMCHAINPLTQNKTSWNLDYNRKDYSMLGTYRWGCNPPKWN